MLDTEQQQTETTSSDVAGASEETSTSVEAQGSERDAPATRDDLVAAAREAMAGAKTEAEPEKPAEAATEEEPRWSRIMKEREKGMAAREAEEKAAADIRAKAEAEAARIVEEARARAKAVADEEQKAWLKTLPSGSGERASCSRWSGRRREQAYRAEHAAGQGARRHSRGAR